MKNTWLGRVGRFIYSSGRSDYEGTVISRRKAGPETTRDVFGGCHEYESQCDDVLIDAGGSIYTGQILQGESPFVFEGSMIHLTEAREKIMGKDLTTWTARTGQDDWFYVTPEGEKHAAEEVLS